jgi:hypothetical protein
MTHCSTNWSCSGSLDPHGHSTGYTLHSTTRTHSTKSNQHSRNQFLETKKKIKDGMSYLDFTLVDALDARIVKIVPLLLISILYKRSVMTTVESAKVVLPGVIRIEPSYRRCNLQRWRRDHRYRIPAGCLAIGASCVSDPDH